MPRPIIKTARVDHKGRLPGSTSASIKDGLHLFAGRVVEITIKVQKRSRAANAYYWGVVIREIRKALSQSGQDVPPDALHDVFKWRYLDPRVVDVFDRSVTLPPSTANLDSTEFHNYVEAIKNDESVRALGVDIPDPVGGLTSWGISEP